MVNFGAWFSFRVRDWVTVNARARVRFRVGLRQGLVLVLILG